MYQGEPQLVEGQVLRTQDFRGNAIEVRWADETPYFFWPEWGDVESFTMQLFRFYNWEVGD